MRLAVVAMLLPLASLTRVGDGSAELLGFLPDHLADHRVADIEILWDHALAAVYLQGIDTIRDVLCHVLLCLRTVVTWAARTIQCRVA